MERERTDGLNQREETIRKMGWREGGGLGGGAGGLGGGGGGLEGLLKETGLSYPFTYIRPLCVSAIHSPSPSLRCCPFSQHCHTILESYFGLWTMLLSYHILLSNFSVIRVNDLPFSNANYHFLS